MLQSTLPRTVAAQLPIQMGPLYHCFHCGVPARGLQPWTPCNSRLDEWKDHFAYLLCNCQCNHRVARLGDCVTPLVFGDRKDYADWRAMVDANITIIQSAVAAIASAMPEPKHKRDAPTKIVYQLLAGHLPPEKAIAQIRALAGRQ